jgi:hypothetical protein
MVRLNFVFRDMNTKHKSNVDLDPGPTQNPFVLDPGPGPISEERGVG